MDKSSISQFSSADCIPAASLSTHIQRLALEERAAVRERDWMTVGGKAGERASLQELRSRIAARRWSKNHG